MVKGMGWEWEPWPAAYRKGGNILVKIFVSVVLMGLSFRLFFSHSPSFLPVPDPPAAAQLDREAPQPPPDPPAMEKAGFSDTPIPETAVNTEDHSQKDKCDLFSGNWIRNPSGPAYTNMTCHFIEPPQNCMKNGRPDTDYVYWKWKPHGCEVQPFDGEIFLNAMRNKSWALIGDSILRNHVQSLICLLAKAEEAVEVYHDKEYKSRRWQFPSHNFTLSLIWSPFLVKADIFENDDGDSKSEIQLYLDTLDNKWTSEYHSFDYVVISGGQWFLKTAIYWENETIAGCHYCPGKNLTEYGVDNAYRKALRLVLNYITSSAHEPLVLYRTWTPDHFEGGEWFSGGTCNRTAPYMEGEYGGRDIDHLMRGIELEEFERAGDSGSKNGTRLKLLDTYHLSLLRPDGHSGPYRNFHPFDKDKNAEVQNDCLHWCLPGPIDSWNDLVMQIVLRE